MCVFGTGAIYPALEGTLEVDAASTRIIFYYLINIIAFLNVLLKGAFRVRKARKHLPTALVM